jgi:hypothetical protein
MGMMGRAKRAGSGASQPMTLTGCLRILLLVSIPIGMMGCMLMGFLAKGVLR